MGLALVRFPYPPWLSGTVQQRLRAVLPRNEAEAHANDLFFMANSLPADERLAFLLAESSETVALLDRSASPAAKARGHELRAVAYIGITAKSLDASTEIVRAAASVRGVESIPVEACDCAAGTAERKQLQNIIDRLSELHVVVFSCLEEVGLPVDQLLQFLCLIEAHEVDIWIASLPSPKPSATRRTDLSGLVSSVQTLIATPPPPRMPYLDRLAIGSTDG